MNTIVTYTSVYNEIHYAEELSLVFCVWKSATANLDVEKYKDEMLAYLDTLKKHNPVNIIHNLRDFQYPVVPEVQQWVDKHINKAGYEAGVRNANFVGSLDLFSAVSVEQLMDEKDGTAFNINYFTSFDEALNNVKEAQK